MSVWLGMLKGREATVLRQRFGLWGLENEEGGVGEGGWWAPVRTGKGRTLGSIAATFAVTRERIRQIQVAAISKIKRARLQGKLGVLGEHE